MMAAGAGVASTVSHYCGSVFAGDDAIGSFFEGNLLAHSETHQDKYCTYHIPNGTADFNHSGPTFTKF
jgi:hypothetical protein